MAEPCALGVIHLSTAFQQVLHLPKALSCTGWGRHSSTESCEEPVCSPDSGVSLCILKGKCWFTIIFPLYNKCYLSNLMYFRFYFTWPCNYRKYRCCLFVQCSCPWVSGNVCAPEPSHNSVIFSLCRNNFTNTHPLHDCRNFCQREPRAGKVPSRA